MKGLKAIFSSFSTGSTRVSSVVGIDIGYNFMLASKKIDEDYFLFRLQNRGY